MGGNVIDFRQARKDRMIADYSYHVRVDQYSDGVAGCILDLGDDLEPEMLRSISDQLFTLARHIRDQAWELSGDPADHVLNTQTIFENGFVRTWTANAIATKDQVDWLRASAEAGFDDVELPAQ